MGSRSHSYTGGTCPGEKLPSGSARCVSCSIQRPGAKRTTNSSSMQGRPGSVQSAARPVWRECGRTSRTTSECSSAEATAKCGARGCRGGPRGDAKTGSANPDVGPGYRPGSTDQAVRDVDPG